MKTALLLPVAAALALFAPGCGGSPTSVPIVRLGYAPHDHHAALYVAALAPDHFSGAGQPHLEAVTPKEEYQLVKDGHVLARVRLAASPGGKELPLKAAEDQLDVIFCGFPAALQQIDRGAPLRILAPVMSGGNGLVLKNSLPVRDWEGFVAAARKTARPLRIGYRVDLSVQSLILEERLRREGIVFGRDLDDRGVQVVLVNLYGGENLVPALANGLVDGFAGVQPYLAQAQEKGVGRVVADFDTLSREAGEREGEGRDYPCCALAARSEFAQAHPDVVGSLVDLVGRANRFIAADPDAASKLVASWLGTSPAVEKRSLPTIRFHSGSGLTWRAGAERWIDALIQAGALKRRVAQARREGTLAEVAYGGPPAAARKP